MVWNLVNETPFAAERCFLRDTDGAETWIVMIRATFVIHPDGTTTRAGEQVPVCLAPEYTGAAGRSSLRYESDIAGAKQGTDILLNGNAYAPDDQKVCSMDTTLRVGAIRKTLRVFGDRVWERRVFGIGMSDPQSFVTMPLLYENAFGGSPSEDTWEPYNPIGKGLSASRENAVSLRLPNVEDPQNLISSWSSRPRPAGFGPICRHWAPRCRLAGSYDEKWQKERAPLLPRDFDERFYQCAPEDQISSSFLLGGEPVELHNMSPTGTLCFHLPKVRLRLRTMIKRREVEHTPNLHTVILEPSIQRIQLVWLGALPCHGAEHTIKGTLIENLPSS